MDDTRITKERVRHHFTYSWWKYALVAVAAIFGWNLIYTSTAYRAPKDKRLDVYFATHLVGEDALGWFREQTLERYPQLEDAACISIVYTEEDTYYGSIQLSTYMAAGEGDVYLLPRERFIAFAASGAFLPLDDAVASGSLNLMGMDVSQGMQADESGQRRLYGIPAGELYGLLDYGVDNRDLFLCATAYTRNPETAVDWMGWFVEAMLAERPDWLTQWDAGQAEEISEMPSF